MISKHFVGPGLVHIRIAVHATVRTGVIGAYIGAFGAAAFFPCRFVTVREAGREKKLLNNMTVNTMRVLDFVID